MRKHSLVFISILWLFIPAVLGCSDTEQNERLNEANARISKLSSENKKLKNQNNELILQQETLEINHGELQEWTKKLVDGYGPGIWYMDESTMPIFIKPVPSGNIKEIIKELNFKFKQDNLPIITLTKTKDKTALISISDAALLTQRMGTHGSISYINAVTYSLASIKGIDCVWLDFKEGDHAIPGKYCK